MTICILDFYALPVNELLALPVQSIVHRPESTVHHPSCKLLVVNPWRNTDLVQDSCPKVTHTAEGIKVSTHTAEHTEYNEVKYFRLLFQLLLFRVKAQGERLRLQPLGTLTLYGDSDLQDSPTSPPGGALHQMTAVSQSRTEPDDA